MRLLVVEDDQALAEGLTGALRRRGHVVDCTRQGRDALTALASQEFDLVVLDLGLPDVDGLSLLRDLRDRRNATPILILTARDGVRTRVQGLNSGADDFLLKPFDFDELEARIRAITRRTVAGSAADLHLGRITVQGAERRISVDEAPLDLSPREFALLELLIHRHGRVVSKQQIQSCLCEWHEDLSDGAIEVHVHRLRRKLEGTSAGIRTLRGFGYMLELRDDG
jgi:two-component system OmpR family response regulator